MTLEPPNSSRTLSFDKGDLWEGERTPWLGWCPVSCRGNSTRKGLYKTKIERPCASTYCATLNLGMQTI